MSARLKANIGPWLTLLAVLGLAGGTSAARADWTFEIIDSAGPSASDAALAIDAAGNPHVSYVDAAGDLKLAKRVGGAWLIEIVPTPYTNGSPGNPSLALDSEAWAHIAFTDWQPYSSCCLFYTHRTKTQWQPSSYVDGVGNAVPSLALTAGDEPRIAYDWYWGGSDGLAYAVPDGSGWSKTVLACCPALGYRPSLVLDSNENPRVGWGQVPWSSPACFTYYWSEGGPWSSETAYSQVNCYSVSMALDTADQPHAAFVDINNTNLLYAPRIAGIWEAETVVANSYVSWSRLALDAFDCAHIAYLGPGNSLEYAHRTTASWCTQTLEGSDCDRPVIAVDSAGNPHIVYYDANSHDFKYARWDPSIVTGDLNWDGCVNFGDINSFVLYLSDFEAWQSVYPYCPPENGDTNYDGIYGQASFRDINPFVGLLTDGN